MTLMLPLLLLPQAAYTCTDKQPGGWRRLSFYHRLHYLIAAHDAEQNDAAVTGCAHLHRSGVLLSKPVT